MPLIYIEDRTVQNKGTAGDHRAGDVGFFRSAYFRIIYVMDRRVRVALSAAPFVLFLAVAAATFRFTMDDAFIIYRYAENLASGHGLAWNPGERPVEGFTSFSWVVLNAAAIAAGLDPEIFSKALGLVFGLATIAIMTKRTAGLRPTARLFVVAAVSSPPFAASAMMGLATALAVLLVTVAAVYSMRLSTEVSAENSWAFHAASFAAMLTRPEAAFFVAGAWAALAASSFYRNDGRGLARLILRGLPFLLLGAAYVALRHRYFGHLLPITYYVKSEGTGLITMGAVKYLGWFALVAAWPYVAAGAGVIARRPDRRSLREAAPALLGSAFFFAYLLSILPIQGTFFRFILPAFPAALLGLARLWESVEPWPKNGRFLAGVAAFAVAWHVGWAYPLGEVMDRLTVRDRALAGKALSGIEGSMLVSESGALPYYSGWRSMDTLGLTSEAVAMEGLTRENIEEFGPDLFMTYVYGAEFRVTGDQSRMIVDWLKDKGFVLAAVVQKAGPSHHFYFVRSDFERFEQTARALRSIEGIDYVPIGETMREDIPVYQPDRGPDSGSVE